MADISPTPEGLSIKQILEQYEGGAGVNNALRKQIDTVDINALAWAAMELEGHETVLDVGGLPGTDLKRARLAGHAGNLIVVDMSKKASDYYPTVFYFQNSHLRPVHFVTGEAQALPFSDNSVDALTMNRVLYHVLPDPEDGIREAKRVMKPDGVFSATTADKERKEKLRVFQKIAGDKVDKIPPPPKTPPFDIDRALERLPQHFHSVKLGVPSEADVATIEDTDPQNPTLLAYKDSWVSDYTLFTPELTPEEGEQTFQDIVVAAINREIKERGVFTERTGQYYIICREIRGD
jgi:SAM-dependent methyltransferase